MHRFLAVAFTLALTLTLGAADWPQWRGPDRTGVSKDALWDTYLASFPEGSNPVYKTRTEHDCQCCKQCGCGDSEQG